MRRQREDDAAKMQQVIKTLRSIVSIGDPDQKYENYKKIGQGASGTVYTAEEVATGRQVRVRTSHKPCPASKFTISKIDVFLKIKM